MLIQRRNLCLTLNYSSISLQMKTKGENFKKFLSTRLQRFTITNNNKNKITHNNNILPTSALTTQK